MIFFDIDDTLLDYRSSQGLAARKFAESNHSILLEPNEFVELWGTITEKHMNRYLQGKISFQEQRRERIRECFDTPYSDEEADSLFNLYYSIYEDSWQLFPECISVLERLNNSRKAIITNGDKSHQTYKLNKLGLSGFFEFVVTPSDAGAAKPSEKIFSYAAELAGMNPNQCWYVGDNLEKDYVGAASSGFSVAWLNRSLEEQPCHAQVSNLVEFVEFIET